MYAASHRLLYTVLCKHLPIAETETCTGLDISDPQATLVSGTLNECNKPVPPCLAVPAGPSVSPRPSVTASGRGGPNIARSSRALPHRIPLSWSWALPGASWPTWVGDGPSGLPSWTGDLKSNGPSDGSLLPVIGLTSPIEFEAASADGLLLCAGTCVWQAAWN